VLQPVYLVFLYMDRLYYLWEQYAANRSTTAELEELYTFLANPAMEQSSKEWYRQQLQQVPAAPADYSEKRLQQILAAIRTQQPAAPPARIFALRWLAAASVILLLATGGYLYFRQSNRKPALPVSKARDIAAPAANRATITLSDGRKIVLDSAAT